MRYQFFYTTLASALVMSGCAVGPNYQRPELNLPVEYVEQSAGNSNQQWGEQVGGQKFVNQDIPAQWWELFHSRELNELVTSAIQHNPGMAGAQAALRTAQENVAAQRGSFYPNVQLSYNPTRQRVSNSLASPAASGATYYSLQTAQVSVAYTIDAFGANRRQVENLQSLADSQRYQYEATYLTLTANVASAAIQEAALRAQIAATREIVESQRQLMAMFRKQYELGQVAQADVAAQEAALANAEASMVPLEKQLALQRDLLKALAGRYPSENLGSEFTLDKLELPKNLPVSVPSSLVEHRPDVRAAEEQLHAASAAIGVAIANRLPNISIGVTGYGSASYNFGELFTGKNAFWTLAGNVVQPVFDGGTLKHRQIAAEANYDQAAAQYKATVINAFQNVADSLQALQIDGNGVHANENAEHAAARSLEFARKQLRLGDISQLALLNAQQTYLQARLALVQGRANQYSDVVALFQSLGGGWWNRVPTNEEKLTQQ